MVTSVLDNDPEDAAKFWGFPFQPYQIQIDFMKKLYECIDQKKIGVFESPTGTGKSLSLICGALTWLKMHSKLEFKEKLDEIDHSYDPSFVKVRKRKLAEEGYQKIIYETNLENQFENLVLHAQENIRNKKPVTPINKYDKDYDPDLVDFYDDNDELDNVISAPSDIRNTSASFMDKELQAMLAQDQEILNGPYYASKGYSNLQNSYVDDSLVHSTIKIYFCSRTHSQLSQTMHELRKTDHSSWVRSLAMSSRMHLCINEEIMKKNGHSSAKLSEACISCQKLLIYEEDPPIQQYDCSYYKPTKSPDSLLLYEHFIRSIFSSGQRSKDIEDLHNLGVEHAICPYYGVHLATRFAQFITLPYACILHQPTREALGIDLRGNIVIFDEAHNLVNAIRSLYEVEIDWELIYGLKLDLQEYLHRYENRLLGKNIYYLNILIKAVDEVQQAWINLALNCPNGGIIPVHSFLQIKSPISEEAALRFGYISSSPKSNTNYNVSNSKGSLLHSINYFKLRAYLQVSQLSRKILGITAKRKKADAEGDIKKQERNADKPAKDKNEEISAEIFETSRNSEEDKVLRPLDTFVEFLCRISDSRRNKGITTQVETKEDVNSGLLEDGKLMYFRKEKSKTLGFPSDADTNVQSVHVAKKPQDEFCLKFLVFHVSSYFQEVCQVARSVILAGGTLQPVEDLLLQLLSTAPERNTETDQNIKDQQTNYANINRSAMEAQKKKFDPISSPVKESDAFKIIPTANTKESLKVSSMPLATSSSRASRSLPSPKIPIHFSCSHVIPPENFLVLNLPFGNEYHLSPSSYVSSVHPKTNSMVTSSPTKSQTAASDMRTSAVPFRFTFENRNNFSLLNSFSQCLLNFLRIIPQGVVLFFPSHQALNIMLTFWQSHGETGALNDSSSQSISNRSQSSHLDPSQPSSGKSFFELINAKKRIFFERQKSVSQLLSSYNACCDHVSVSTSGSQNLSSMESDSSAPVCTGAILMAVMGGRLSEGINFSDGRGRAIFIAGLPYPNPHDILVKEQKKYYDYSWYKRHFQQRPLSTPGSSSVSDSRVPQQKNTPQYLENLCMNLVNQTIGRVLRHASDYAVVFLCDIRFHELHHQLPTWMFPYYRNYFTESFSSQNPYGKCIREVVLFFKQKKQQSVKPNVISLN